jgi:hypothetical protein
VSAGRSHTAVTPAQPREGRTPSDPDPEECIMSCPRPHLDRSTA